jgi:2-dehydrotetronate isomerase
VRIAANLSMLFTERPLFQRPAAAAVAGFDGAEILFPYEDDPAALRDALLTAGLPLALHNTPPGDWAAGERGFAAVPGQQDRFRRDIEQALRVAEVLRPDHIHVLTGRADGPKAEEVLIENLLWATAQSPQSFTLEPLNPVDQPGYFLCDFDLAARVLDAVAAPNLGLQYDVYHAQMITGDPLAVWATHGHRAVHVQVARAPGRREPQGGPTDWPAVWSALAGFPGWISAEYTPEVATEDGLGWLRVLRAGA